MRRFRFFAWVYMVVVGIGYALVWMRKVHVLFGVSALDEDT
jgi:hypothetical protein